MNKIAVIQAPGSSDVITIVELGQFELHPAGDYLQAVEPRYWVDKNGVDPAQNRAAWMAHMTDALLGGGHVLAALHTSSGDKIIAVAYCEPTGRPREMELLAQTKGGYAAANDDPHLSVDERMVRAMKDVCAQRGYTLGRSVMVRNWVPA